MNDEAYIELKQTKPFASMEHAAHLSIIRTSSMLMDAFERMLKPHDITATQFNVLRILRGAAPDGLCRNEIRDRMVNRMPDVTRLLDRMEEAGLIGRERSGEDRRMVRTRITAEGNRVLDMIDDDVVAEQKRPFKGLDDGQLNTLVELLAKARRNL
jgi:DNA-binding MarR family transcriptional regulator